MNIKQVESKHITIRSPYLEPLCELAVPPPQLHLKGLLPKLRQPSVAIVGTRRPSSYGTQVSYDLAYKLAQSGVVIISGLAFGVDAAAHKGALDAGGITIAVLANGLGSIYPASHSALAKRIVAQGGALLSEYPDSHIAYKHHFLARNRLISGLADILIVTEAAERSGTLSTVHHALDQNKDIYAVPGPITSPLSVGPNRLIAQGANPLLGVEDIFEHLFLTPLAQLRITDSFSELETRILTTIQQGSLSTNALIESGLEKYEAVVTTLTSLEMKGVIRQDRAGIWRSMVID